MALNKTDKSFKTLINKRFTTPDRNFFQEIGKDTINTHMREVWMNTIPIDSASAITQGYAEYHEQFILTADPTFATQAFYFISGSGFTPGTDSINSGWLINESSQSYFRNNFISDKYGSSYEVKLYDNNDNQIFKTDTINWIFDYATGVLHVADPGAYAVPYKVTVFKYSGLTLADPGAVSGSTSFWTGSGDYIERLGDVKISGSFYVSSSTQLIGNVGIGTDIPTQFLIHVSSSNPGYGAMRIDEQEGWALKIHQSKSVVSNSPPVEPLLDIHRQFDNINQFDIINPIILIRDETPSVATWDDAGYVIIDVKDRRNLTIHNIDTNGNLFVSGNISMTEAKTVDGVDISEFSSSVATEINNLQTGSGAAGLWTGSFADGHIERVSDVNITGSFGVSENTTIDGLVGIGTNTAGGYKVNIKSDFGATGGALGIIETTGIGASISQTSSSLVVAANVLPTFEISRTFSGGISGVMNEPIFQLTNFVGSAHPNYTIFNLRDHNVSDIFSVDNEGNLTLTGHVTMSAGKTVDGVDISEFSSSVATQIQNLSTSSLQWTLNDDGTISRDSDVKISGSLYLSGSDNRLYATASWAESSSQSVSASSALWSISSSFAENTLSSSFSTWAVSSSFADLTISASFATTSSYATSVAPGIGGLWTGSFSDGHINRIGDVKVSGSFKVLDNIGMSFVTDAELLTATRSIIQIHNTGSSIAGVTGSIIFINSKPDVTSGYINANRIDNSIIMVTSDGTEQDTLVNIQDSMILGWGHKVNTLDYGSILSGYYNTVSNTALTIIGGDINYVDNTSDSLIVGYRVTVSGSTEILSVGQDTLMDSVGWGAVIGRDHTMIEGSHYSVILGGRSSKISGSSEYSAILAADSAQMGDGTYNCAIVSGFGATMAGSGYANVIIGGIRNAMAGGTDGVILGGQDNIVTDDYPDTFLIAGKYIQIGSDDENTFVIGAGNSSTNRLVNNNNNSIWLGFRPTAAADRYGIFIEDSGQATQITSSVSISGSLSINTASIDEGLSDFIVWDSGSGEFKRRTGGAAGTSGTSGTSGTDGLPGLDGTSGTSGVDGISDSFWTGSADSSSISRDSDVKISGSLYLSGSDNRMYGTASWAESSSVAVSSSHALTAITASYAHNAGGGVGTTFWTGSADSQSISRYSDVEISGNLLLRGGDTVDGVDVSTFYADTDTLVLTPFRNTYYTSGSKSVPVEDIQTTRLVANVCIGRFPDGKIIDVFEAGSGSYVIFDALGEVSTSMLPFTSSTGISNMAVAMSESLAYICYKNDGDSWFVKVNSAGDIVGTTVRYTLSGSEDQDVVTLNNGNLFSIFNNSRAEGVIFQPDGTLVTGSVYDTSGSFPSGHPYTTTTFGNGNIFIGYYEGGLDTIYYQILDPTGSVIKGRTGLSVINDNHLFAYQAAAVTMKNGNVAVFFDGGSDGGGGNEWDVFGVEVDNTGSIIRGPQVVSSRDGLATIDYYDVAASTLENSNIAVGYEFYGGNELSASYVIIDENFNIVLSQSYTEPYNGTNQGTSFTNLVGLSNGEGILYTNQERRTTSSTDRIVYSKITATKQFTTIDYNRVGIGTTVPQAQLHVWNEISASNYNGLVEYIDMSDFSSSVAQQIADITTGSAVWAINDDGSISRNSDVHVTGSFNVSVSGSFGYLSASFISIDGGTF